MVKRTILLALVALAASTCAKTAGLPASAQSGVSGRVLLGPSCPVERADTPCPDRPIQARVEARDRSGKLVTAIESSDRGAFRLALAPGTYELRAMGDAGLVPLAKPVTVTVRAGRITSVQLIIDTGIR
jgi:hypothetical protein